MADLQQLFGVPGFDTHSVNPQTDFAAIPPGKYPVIVEKAEVKQTKAGTGHYLEVQFSVLDGQCRNCKLWDRINVDNPNQQCVDIGLRSLSALGQSLGIANIQATEQLLNGVCIAHVKVKNEQNEIRTYSPLTPAAAPGIPQVPFVAPPAYIAPPAQVYVAPPVQQAPPQQNTASMPGPINQPATAVKPPWAR
jgi:hypothetical protein